jgi:hydroxyquinol 1,2-dioxygenase
LNFDESNLTEAVIARMQGCEDPRLRQIMTSLVRHLHDFVREVELTEAEWLEAIRFLTATGQKCDDKRQEFILLSDTLGVSMLVDAINHRVPAGATQTTVFGPFFVEGAPEMPHWADITNGASGKPCFVSGTVRDAAGKPLAGVVVDVWQTDGEEGFYDVQKPGGSSFCRAKIRTDADGCFAFRTVQPISYPVPTDGPVGRMLLQMGRHPYRPAHIHTMLTRDGYKPLITHLFVRGDRYLDSDAVFGVKDSLVVDFVDHPAGIAPDGKRIDRPYSTASYDFVLAGQD